MSNSQKIELFLCANPGWYSRYEIELNTGLCRVQAMRGLTRLVGLGKVQERQNGKYDEYRRVTGT